MKILHIPYWYFPDPPGGTEIYVHSLCRHLIHDFNVECVVAAAGEENQSYEWDGVPVRRFQKSPNLTLRELYGAGDPEACLNFEKVLEEEKPSLVHLHSLTSAHSKLLLKACRKKSIPTVLTYHTPSVTCPRGNLLKWGRDVCRGDMAPSQCVPCMFQKKGVPRLMAYLAAAISGLMRHLAISFKEKGGLWTGLRMSELVHVSHASSREALACADAVVAPSAWVKDVLVRNGVNAQKIYLSKQGIKHEVSHKDDGVKDRQRNPQEPLKVVFLGRACPQKGLDILVDAVFKCSGNIELDAYCTVQNAEDKTFIKKIKEKAGRDARIKILGSLKNNEVISVLTKYDYLMVPSRFLETGPLVVLEAFSAGVPVIAAGFGGICDLVSSMKNGILIPSFEVKAWAKALNEVCFNRDLQKQLAAGICAPKTMKTVAGEMCEVYKRVLGTVNS